MDRHDNEPVQNIANSVKFDKYNQVWSVKRVRITKYIDMYELCHVML